MFGVNGFVIGPVIAALFVTVWEIFGSSRVRPDAPPEAVPIEVIAGSG